MIIVGCQHLKKYHGANLVLADVTFEIGEGDRVGLVGPNGSGKSTLLHLLAGLQKPDEGQLSIQKRTRIGYLPQVPVERDDVTVYDVLALGYREVFACRALMRELEARMADQSGGISGAQMEAMLRQYAEQQEQFQRLGGYEMEAHIQQVARGLEIPQEQFDRPYASLSGGERTKVGLASLLIERPTLLLLDEPTNHLDTQGIEWLESFLRTYDGTCLIVSHDRYFLDRVVTRIIDLEDGEAVLYHTNYSGYVKEKEERLLQQFADYKEQQKKIRKMEETIQQLQEWGRIGANEKFFRRAASMQKALDRMERLKRPVLERRSAEFDLQEADRSGREVLKVAALSKRFDQRSLLRQVDAALSYGEKVVLVGQNGTGKSTFFKLLLGQEQPDEGRVEVGARVEVGYLAQQDQPDGGKTVLEAFCEQARLEQGEARGQLARYLFYGADVFKQLSHLSGGEWTRFRLALLMHQKPNLLLLDEPTNHLDIASREALEEALEEFPGTVLAISHDRYFANRIAAKIWELADGQLTGYLGGYDDYREQRERRRMAVEQAQSAKASEKVQSSPRTRPERKREPAKRTRAQVEEAIRRLEDQIAALDADLKQAQEAGDLARLNAGWVEREELTKQADAFYAEWMELEDA